jgi:ArsR family transcriptional regulator, arsenate/arsenite/antimonite-responsive transcriptional repressor
MSVGIQRQGRLAAVFRALGDPTRLRIFEVLRSCQREVGVDESGECHPDGALSVGQVCCRFDLGMSTVSHHLRELRLAGLIQTERRSRWIYCSVDPEGLALIEEFLARPNADAPPTADG